MVYSPGFNTVHKGEVFVALQFKRPFSALRRNNNDSVAYHCVFYRNRGTVLRKRLDYGEQDDENDCNPHDDLLATLWNVVYALQGNRLAASMPAWPSLNPA